MFDIRDVNYLRFSQKFRYPSKKVMGITLKRGLLYGIANFFISFIFSFFYNPLSFRALLKKSRKTVLVYNGSNQYNALIGIYKAANSLGEDIALIKNSELPMWRSYILAIGCSLNFWKFYFHSSPEEKRIIANELASFWRSYGDYKLIIQWLGKAHIEKFLVANDHVPFFRAAVSACNDSNVISAYIQHAAVTEKFPPLIATYSFLDGVDSLEKYKFGKVLKSRIYIIGGARFDLAEPSSLEDTSNTIGIALTRRDEKKCWEELISSIKVEYPDRTIVLRPHPRMEKDTIRRYCLLNGIQYSDPSRENSFEFLQHIGFLIANETSTHLDAMIMHKPTVLYSGLSSTGLRDHYGMVKSGLLMACSSFEELKEYVFHPSKLAPSVEGVRYFNASYLSRFEFRVSELIANIIFNEDQVLGRLVEIDGIYYLNYDE